MNSFLPSLLAADGPTSFWFFVVVTVPHGQLVGYFSRPGAGPEESETRAPKASIRSPAREKSNDNFFPHLLLLCVHLCNTRVFDSS